MSESGLQSHIKKQNKAPQQLKTKTQSMLNKIKLVDFPKALINPKIIAGLIAILIGYFTKNIIATIFSGLFSYWILIFLIGY